MARLKKVDCSGPGIRRRRRGKGFEYLDDDGRRVSEPSVIERIRELAIPPAWEDVWICPYPMGHIQATGTDAAGRKQYRYHDRWRERRDAREVRGDDRLRAGAAATAQARREGPPRDGMPRDKVLACAMRLLDRGFFRIGSENYAEENDTYGIATMRKDHVEVSEDEVTFDYEAKGGQRRVQVIGDPEVAEVARAMKRRRGGGEELLAYKDGHTLGGREVGRHQRVPQAGHRRRLQRQGLPHLERHRARRGGARGGGHGVDVQVLAHAREVAGGEGGGALPGQHAGRLPRLVHRPARVRPLRRRPHHRRGAPGARGGHGARGPTCSARSRRPCSI